MFKKKNPEIQEIPQAQPQVQVNQTTKRLVVVKQLPVKEVREAELEDGSIAELVTTEEALAEILEAVRRN